jgi:hypothetical protein
VTRLAISALIAALSFPCFGQERKASANPTQMDTNLLWRVRDRIIDRGQPMLMSNGSVQSCLADGVSFRPAQTTLCLDAEQAAPESKDGVSPAVLRYNIRNLTVNVQDGDDHYVFIISPLDRVVNAIHIDKSGIPSSADVSIPQIQALLRSALKLALSLPYIEA